MAIEQVKPNKPNFKLIGILVIVAIPVFFVIAWVLVRMNGGHMLPSGWTKHSVSQLTMPVPPRALAPVYVTLG